MGPGALSLFESRNIDKSNVHYIYEFAEVQKRLGSVCLDVVKQQDLLDYKNVVRLARLVNEFMAEQMINSERRDFSPGILKGKDRILNKGFLLYRQTFQAENVSGLSSDFFKRNVSWG